jgi:hypothetical protein
VDPGTGLILAEGCQPQSGPAYREYFLRGMSPPSVCPSRGLPPEMLAGLELPLPDDEDATDLSIDLPADLLPPVHADAAEEAEVAEEADSPDGAERTEPAPEAEPPREPAEEAEPSPEPTPTPAPPATPAAGATAPPTPQLP